MFRNAPFTGIANVLVSFEICIESSLTIITGSGFIYGDPRFIFLQQTRHWHIYANTNLNTYTPPGTDHPENTQVSFQFLRIPIKFLLGS